MKPVIGVTMHTKDSKFEINNVYIKSVEQAGGLPLCLPHIHASDVETILTKINGLLLIGGQDMDPYIYGQEPHPKLGEFFKARDESDLLIVKAAFEKKMPILAICRGHQVLNVAFGGTLIQDIESELEYPSAHTQSSARHVTTHTVNITGGKLKEIIGKSTIRTNSFHHQAVDEIGMGLVSAAVATDGVNEALEHPDHPYCISVQWHPEELAPVGDGPAQRLFKSFIEAAQQ